MTGSLAGSASSVIALVIAALILFGTRPGRSLLDRSFAGQPQRDALPTSLLFAALIMAALVGWDLLLSGVGALRLLDNLILSAGFGLIVYVAARRARRERLAIGRERTRGRQGP